VPIANGLRFGLILTLILMLSACSVSQALRPDYYTVKRGDSLYTIGQHFNVDWHKLARWNHIGPPYRIYVGEKLTLKPYPKLDYAHMGSGKQRQVVRPPQKSQQQQRTIDNSIKRLNEKSSNSSENPSVKASGADQADQEAGHKTAAETKHNVKQSEQRAKQKQTKTKPSVVKSSAQSSATPKASSPTPGHELAQSPGPGNSHWQWPASGAVIQNFSKGGHDQGVEIGGKNGEPIYAASSGIVVYNGPGLKGFGRLIIIKHPRHYLSAYGFVRQSRVSKGEHVSVGQRIASMGLGPGQTAMLHFEIRHDGDPINPARLLPDR